MKTLLWFPLVGLALAGALCLGQTTGGGGGAGVVRGVAGATYSGSFTTSVPTFNMPAVTGAPYSGEEVSETVQTLADGTHITRSGTVQRVYRDSQGRTRTERQLGGSARPGARPQAPVIVEIRDPVAGLMYLLDTQGKVAHRITLSAASSAVRSAAPQPRTAPAPAAAPAAADPYRPEFKHESLGSEMIEGVMAQGSRTTTTYPVGAEGNDRPIVVTQESWTSPELGVSLLWKISDPRSGDRTQKLTNISRTEPEAGLFQPPADYAIVDEAGPSVTIRWQSQ
jgi:hypothetical protein